METCFLGVSLEETNKQAWHQQRLPDCIAGRKVGILFGKRAKVAIMGSF